MLTINCRQGLLCLCAFFLLQTAHSQEIVRISNAVPSLAVETNLLHDVSFSMNLGVELTLDKNLTFKLPVTWNPWKLDINEQYRFLLVQPELRWWLCEAFSGHFFGIHTHYAYFNIGGVFSEDLKKYRRQGWLTGLGLSYGYQFYLAPRWNLELNIGAGYAFINADKYKCETCGDLLEKNEIFHYFGITQAGITLIYLLK
ncbi:hypothetical protein FACS189413_07270 [Bacteroidia bacterium]|nr:hypothetical protein FACS189413_07270 [Bacteroidia bacterium]